MCRTLFRLHRNPVGGGGGPPGCRGTSGTSCAAPGVAAASALLVGLAMPDCPAKISPFSTPGYLPAPGRTRYTPHTPRAVPPPVAAIPPSPHPRGAGQHASGNKGLQRGCKGTAPAVAPEAAQGSTNHAPVHPPLLTRGPPPAPVLTVCSLPPRIGWPGGPPPRAVAGRGEACLARQEGRSPTPPGWAPAPPSSAPRPDRPPWRAGPAGRCR